MGTAKGCHPAVPPAREYSHRRDLCLTAARAGHVHEQDASEALECRATVDV